MSSINEVNSLELDLLKNGKKHAMNVKLSKPFFDKNAQSWCTCAKISTVSDDWMKIYGEDSWQSMVRALGFIRKIIVDLDCDLYLKDSKEKFPMDRFFPF